VANRIEQGRRDRDVRPDVDARSTAEFLLNTNTGLRIRARTHEAPALYRIIDIALTTL
jgi:TetR/AcrR family transcriptional repressor of nem operon